MKIRLNMFRFDIHRQRPKTNLLHLNTSFEVIQTKFESTIVFFNVICNCANLSVKYLRLNNTFV